MSGFIQGGINMIQVVTLFSGVGSQEMALKRLGIPFQVVAMCEIDKFAIQSYTAIHGETRNLGDISKVHTKEFPNCDLLTYSFPCQDISQAGNMAGFEKGSDTRSSLLWECARAIVATKPKYLLMENVKALVSKKFMPHYQEWLDWLERQGYTNYSQVLNAKDYGVPQNRERVFCVSILGEHEPYQFPTPIPLEKKLRDVLEDEVDEKYYLKDEIAARLIFKENHNLVGYIPSKFKQNGEVMHPDGHSTTLCARDYKGPKQIIEVGKLDMNWKESMKRVMSDEGICSTLCTMQGGHRQPKIIRPCLTPDRVEKRQNGRRFKENDEPMFTITTQDRHGVLIDYRIRKLTPLETWRLMNFSDEDFYKAQNVCSNSQLYKQAGNSIVVAVLEGIFRNMNMTPKEKETYTQSNIFDYLAE